jgi:hypothetical protein
MSNFRTVFDQLPRASLQTVSIESEAEAKCASMSSSLPGLLSAIPISVRKLSIACPEDHCIDYGQMKLDIPNLEHLILHVTKSALSASVGTGFVDKILRRCVGSIRKLDIVCVADSRGPPDGTSLASLGEASSSVRLKSVTLRHVMLNGPLKRFIIFGASGAGLESVQLSHCQSLGPTLESLSAVVPTWCSLRSLVLVLPEMQMHLNPAALRLIESLLCSLPCTSLRQLQIEGPGGGNLPDPACIARHWKLQSLVVAVTDSDGRWMAYHPSALEVITSHCLDMQCMGLSMPSSDEWLATFVSARSYQVFGHLTQKPKTSLSLLRLATILVIGIKESSPHPSAPAWVQYCPTREGLDAAEEASALTAAQSISTVVEQASVTDHRLRLSVGVHIGPYYCRDWLEELIWFEGGGITPRRIEVPFNFHKSW